LSTYGTWLNGERVRRRSRLRAGDVLRLGVPGVELVLLAVQSVAPGELLAASSPGKFERN
jgi:pSer/pThr/pTyr-binding forkhead associated (FHA) protein